MRRCVHSPPPAAPTMTGGVLFVPRSCSRGCGHVSSAPCSICAGGCGEPCEPLQHGNREEDAAPDEELPEGDDKKPVTVVTSLSSDDEDTARDLEALASVDVVQPAEATQDKEVRNWASHVDALQAPCTEQISGHGLHPTVLRECERSA